MIINTTSQDPITRPPAPLPDPGPENVTCDVLYEDPDALQRWPPPYNEIQVQSNGTPPATPPPRVQTTETTAFLEERIMTSGMSDRTSEGADTNARAESTKHSHLPVYQNGTTFAGTAPLSNDEMPSPDATEKVVPQYSNTSLLRNPFDTCPLPPTTEARELSDSNRPALSKRESQGSVTLDPDGYIKCIH